MKPPGGLNQSLYTAEGETNYASGSCLMAEITLFIAFLAGIVSFLSPCVLPIVPGFLAYLAGTTASKPGGGRREIFLNSLFFVLGFSFIFSLLGVLLNSILSSVAASASVWLSRIGGTIIIAFGLYLTGLLEIPFLKREHKLAVKQKFGSRYATSFAFGAAFAAGWTPCVGAVLGGILGLAAAQPGAAFALLASYSLGLGLPFLLVGLFTAQAGAFIKANAHSMEYVTKAFGVLLVIIGILVFTQEINRLANFDLLNRVLLGK